MNISPENSVATVGELDERTICTILGALRHLQNNYEDISNYPHFIDVDPLDSQQIDNLCESITCNSISIQ